MSTQPTTDFAGLPDEEVRLLLRKRKKTTQGGMSCFPCKKRKVKCDRCSPCNNCASRGYPELCSFSGTPAASSELSSSTGSKRSKPSNDAEIQTAVEEAGEDSNSNIFTIPTAAPPGNGILDLQYSEHNSHNQSNNNSHALENNGCTFRATSQPEEVATVPEASSRIIRDAMKSILGLEESNSSYQALLLSQTTQNKSLAEVQRTLPVNRDIIRLFRNFKQLAHPFAPIIPDIAAFEVELCTWIERNSQRDHTPVSQPSEQVLSREVSWMGLLFAVLASGVHFSDSSSGRYSTSQIFLRSSFQCLRLVEYLTRPSLLNIQALLVIGSVLQNQMKPETAWTLLGTTARMGYSLDLYKQPFDESSERWKLWQSLVWQDSLLSLCLDRPPATYPPRTSPKPPLEFSYIHSMNALCDTILHILQNKNSVQTSNFELVAMAHITSIEQIRSECVRHMETGQHESDIQRKCESHALILHTSFITAWTCRLSFPNRINSSVESISQGQLIEKFKSSLRQCVRSFLALYALSAFAVRSWATRHNGISSALWLGLLHNKKEDYEVRTLLAQIIEIFESETDESEKDQLASNEGAQILKPYAQALIMLKRLYQDQTNLQKPAQMVVGEYDSSPPDYLNVTSQNSRMDNLMTSESYNMQTNTEEQNVASEDNENTLPFSFDIPAFETIDSIFLQSTESLDPYSDVFFADSSNWMI